MTGMVRDMEPDVARMRQAAGEGYATATDLADWLTRTLKLPFREAHHLTGRIVAEAAEAGVPLDKLPLPPCRRSSRASPRRSSRVLSVEPRSRAAPSMAAPRRKTSARRPNAGSKA